MLNKPQGHLVRDEGVAGSNPATPTKYLAPAQSDLATASATVSGRDYPIIFSGPMVRALLAGRKTMTRRLAWQEPHKAALVGCDYSSEELEDFDVQGWNVELRGSMTYVSKPSPWQRVEPGDRLWVRESLTHVTSDPVTAEPCSVHCYTASIPPGMDSANPYEPNYLFADDGVPALKPKGIPSIHMPRWASRITLTVTATKVERLQMIRRADIVAEGVASGVPVEFTALWDSLHGDGAWAANPEVVALTFTVEPCNIDAR